MWWVLFYVSFAMIKAVRKFKFNSVLHCCAEHRIQNYIYLLAEVIQISCQTSWKVLVFRCAQLYFWNYLRSVYQYSKTCWAYNLQRDVIKCLTKSNYHCIVVERVLNRSLIVSNWQPFWVSLKQFPHYALFYIKKTVV